MLAEPTEQSTSGSHVFHIGDYINPNNYENLIFPDTTYVNLDTINSTFKHCINPKYSCLHLNIQSLPSKFESLKELLATLYEHNINIDFIMLCETFLNDNITQFYNIPGYNLVTHNRTKQLRGGVAIYVSTNYNYNIRTDLAINVEGQFESVFIEAKSNKYNETVIVGEIYRVPNTNINESLAKYQTIINKLSQYKNVYVGTDQNIDYLKINQHKGTADLLDHFLSGGLIPVINKPTRITHKSATLIDNIYTRINPTHELVTCVMHYDISDHLPLITLIGNRKAPKHKPLTFTFRPLNSNNVNTIIDELNNNNWDMLDSFEDVNESYNYFTNVVDRTIDKHAPIITKTIPASKVIRDPWYSKGLLKSSRHLHRLYHKAIGKPPNDDTHQKYKQYRNILNNLKRTAKQEYYKREFEKHKNSIKKTWQIINNILNKTSNKFTILDFFNAEPKAVANEFCIYFSEVGSNFAKNIPCGKYAPEFYLKGTYLNSLYLNPTDEDEIIKIICSQKSTASCGHDNISSILVKKLNYGLVAPLTRLINKSFEAGVVPDQLKIAKVIPIHKKGDKGEYSNYRPISLLPTFSKIYEKVMHKRLYSYLMTKSIIYDSQYGFRQGHSTTQAVSELIENITQGFDQFESTLAIFLDLSKAFDTINHSILLKKLEFYGIRGKALDWFTSYLHNRKQYVSLDGHDSDTHDMICGVPQGSVLGPLLFIIYTNDLPANLTHCKSILFADDTTIYKSSKDLNQLFELINSDLNIATEWFYSNQLSLNTNKTHYVLFSLKKASTTGLHIHLAGTVIEGKEHVKFLGIIVDEKLSWKYHIDYVKTRLISALFAMRRLKNIASATNLLTLYYSFFYPHIDYGLILWGGAPKANINKICVMQKKAIRLITNTPYNAQTTPLFAKMKILKLSDIYVLQLAKFVYCLYRNDLPKPLQLFFSTNNEVHKYYTRNCDNPCIPLHKTNVAARSIYNKSYQIWYNMESDMKCATSLASFSSKFKRFILEKYTAM